MTQAFDRVWYDGLLYKLQFLPVAFYLLFKSFPTYRYFTIHYHDKLSSVHPIKASVFQDSILALTLYNIFTADIPQSDDTTLTTFADDTGVISSNLDINIATRNLQNHLLKLQHWFIKLWRMKINENKSNNITFRLWCNDSTPVFLNENIILKVDTVKYLGVYLDKRLTWVSHIKIKKKSLNLKIHQFRHLLRSNSSFSNKLLIYKQIIRPTMTYDIQLWGSAKNSNLKIVQASQSINLRLKTKASLYVSNYTLHNNLNICILPTLAHIYYSNFHVHTHNHPNTLISNLFSTTIPNSSLRRLKHNWSLVLLT